MHISFLDWSIVFAYFVFALLVGLYFAKRAGKGLSDYFISGRSLPWWLIGTSMVATTFSTDTPNLVTDIVRNSGISGNWVWWPFLLTGMVTVFFYARLWRRSEVLTDVEFYEIRYSGKSAAFLRGFRAVYLGLFFNVMIMAAVTLAAIKIGSVLLGLNKYTIVVICSVLALFYSVLSGFWGVVITDLVQFCMAMFGSIAAAIYALKQPEVGGLGGLIQKLPADKTSILPDLSTPEIVIPVLIIPFAVQWWSVWYPGAEPGGGGYVCQRMLASKNEKHSMWATLWFTIAHYALRPWPWIIVALCSLVVYPELKDIAAKFPSVDPAIVKHDLGYPAMLVFLPKGILGIMLASLVAAYMSTIDTHLNWGASYIVNDCYKRFIKKEAPGKHYVLVSRLTTVVLMIIAGLVSLLLQNALEAFQILLQIGAGTGLIFLLRWFYWRINAYSEIVGMMVSFIVAVFFKFSYTELPAWQELVIGVGITTTAWFIVTFLTRPSDMSILKSFYSRIRPIAVLWGPVARQCPEVKSEDSLTHSILCFFLSVVFVYAALFSVGLTLLDRMGSAVWLYGVGIISGFLLFRLMFRKGSLTR
jgi:Na+/proline symporter